LSRVTKFSTQNNTTLGGAGTDTSFTFGVNPGGIDADVYALRFISSNPGATGGFVYFSDQRMKHNITTADFSALTQIVNTPVRQFQWTDSGVADYGWVAQEAPTSAQVPLTPPSPVDTLTDVVGISSERMVVLLWKALQEIAAAINWRQPDHPIPPPHIGGLIRGER
jgi:hypothetical protein